jgi:cyclopropane fatty-acyl-phospholipid synthase-like methyltransferase
MEYKKYRSRIYDQYQSSGQKSASPQSIIGLEPRAAMFRNIIRQHFTENIGASILDLGCGHGAFIHFLKEAGYYNIIGVDVSPEQVKKAQMLGIPEVIQEDIKKYMEDNVEPESQDYIISFDIIEHFDKNELIDFIDQVFRALRPGGKWIIHTPNGTSPFFGNIFFGDYTHEQAFTVSSISQVLYASGYSKVTTYEEKPVPHGFNSSLRLFLWKVIKIFLRFYFLVETGHGGRDLIFSQNFLTVAEK